MSNWNALYAVRDLPVFQNRMFSTADEARLCTKGDVVLVQDEATGLVRNEAFDARLMEYDANYQNEQAVSSVFQRHLEDVSTIIAKHFSGLSLIEVGCGKGHFLEQLKKSGFKVVGLDPTYEGSNPAVIKTYFTREVGLQGDGLILRHVLEHVADPVAFLSAIRDANGGRGKIYIEVPCFDWICEHKAWFDIFYEHVNYFRLADFRRMFEMVYEAGHTFHGQYLYVVADLATLRKPRRESTDRIAFPSDFLETVDKCAEHLRAPQASPPAVWGAASKGVVFCLFMQREGIAVGTVIDINPAKHGKYLPATGILVSSPEQAGGLPDGSEIFVMNGNYLQEISQQTNGRFKYFAIDN